MNGRRVERDEEYGLSEREFENSEKLYFQSICEIKCPWSNSSDYKGSWWGCYI